MNAISPIPMRHRSADTTFPKGWYCIAEAEQLTADAMLPLSWLGQELIAYRTKDGQAQVADAYCPHLGAHLASHDGKLCEGRITCPFHKWEFDSATGKVEHIPYTDVPVPASVRLTLHPTRETDGMILIWHDPNGGKPSFEPFDSSGLRGDDTWIPYAVKSWETTCPFRDMLENIFDTAHVTQLHNAAALPEITVFEPRDYGLHVEYTTDPNAGEETPIKGFEMNLSGISLLTQYYQGVSFTALFVISLTPIDGERMVEKARLFLKDNGDRQAIEQIGEAFISRFCFEVEQDLKVLDYKKHLPQPRLCAGDGPIMKFRNYAAQFYG